MLFFLVRTDGLPIELFDCARWVGNGLKHHNSVRLILTQKIVNVKISR